MGLLTAAAFGLRWVGLEHGLPHWFEPDAEMGQQVEYLRGARRGEQRASAVATYPMLPAMVAARLFEAPPAPKDVGPVGLPEHLRLASAHLADARRAVALLSLLMIPGAFVLARRFVAPSWALAATALVAVSFLNLNFAQQGRPHAAAAAFYPWAVAAMIALRERGSAASYLAAGAATGLALGCLHNALALLPALIVAHLLRGRRHALDPRVLLTGAALALSVWAFYPYLFDAALVSEADPPPVSAVEGKGLAVGNHVIEFALFNGAGVRRVLRTLWWYEPALLAALAIASLAFVRWLWSAPPGARRPDDATLIVLGYLGPYLLVLGVFAETVERFLAPTVPFFAILAARGFVWLESRTGRRVALRAAWAAAVAFTLLCSLKLSALRARPDTLELAAAWLEEHIEPESDAVFLSPIPSKMRMDSSIDLPLIRSERALKGRGGPRPRYYNIWSLHQTRVPGASLPTPRYDIEWLVSEGRSGAVQDGRATPLSWREDAEELFERHGPALYVIERQLERRDGSALFELQGALERFASRVAVFEPDAVGLPLSHQDRDGEPGRWPHVAWRFLTARHFGPVVEIWRYPGDQARR